MKCELSVINDMVEICEVVINKVIKFLGFIDNTVRNS